jgi:TetR/AcrR family transcriptional regulator
MTRSAVELEDAPSTQKLPQPRPAGKRGRPRKSETDSRTATRDSLLQAARDAMVAKNSIDVSLAEISEITGNSPGLIVYHFQNKEGLLLSLIELDAAKATSQLEGLRALDIPADKKMRMHIGGILSAYFKTPYANRLLNELMQNASPESARHVSEVFLKPIADFQRDLLDQGVKEGVFRPVDPTDFYFIILGACDHLFARPSALKNIFGVERITDETRRRYSKSLTDLVMAGIAA